VNLKEVVMNAYGAMTHVIGGLWTRYGGQGWTRWRAFLPSARFDWEREAGDTWMNSVAALSISWLGDRFPRPRINLSKIARNGDFVPLGRHPLIDLWNRPNGYYGRRAIEKAIGLSLKVDGNAYIWKVRNRNHEVVELWWIPHFRCFPTWPSTGEEYIDGYKIWVDTVQYWLPKSEVIHIRDGVDPRNERIGLSALRATLREVVTVNLEGSYTAGILKNAGVPGVVIAPDDDKLRPSDEDAERIKGKFKEAFGIENDQAGSTAVLKGKYKVTALGFSPEQMTLKDLPLNAIGRISAAIGVAAMSVGLPDPGKTYSNLGEANKASWGTIVSIQELVGDTLRWELVPEFGLDPHQYVIEYDYQHIQELQEPLDAIHTRIREDFAGNIITQNEAREERGNEPVDGGDVFFYQLTQSQVDPGEGAQDEIGGALADESKRFKPLTNGNGRWH
jgi:HK97 family phage portal protein